MVLHIWLFNLRGLRGNPCSRFARRLARYNQRKHIAKRSVSFIRDPVWEDMDLDRAFIDKVIKITSSSSVFENAMLSEYTSFKTGGPADCLVRPRDAEEVRQLVKLAREEKVPFYCLGNGTNMLVSDDGYRGLIISLKDMAVGLEFTEMGDGSTYTVSASAGCTLARLSSEAASRALTGLEFAAGIPGSVGGAVVMNAGAYGGEIKDVFDFASVLDEDGNILRLNRDQLGFGYRKSIIQEKNYIVLKVSFILKKGDAEAIKTEIKELGERRRDKQPLEYPSAGSTFKRPEGLFAGKLIEESGLKGFSVGDAAVSEKHCGFVINKGHASSSDIYELISQVIEKVYEKTGVVLEPEIKLLGFDE